MIEYLRGTCVQRTPTTAIIDVHGVGYEVFITINTYNHLNEGQEDTKLLIHEIIREDTHDLYGFAEEIERRLFRMLITVNSVGASTAQMMLSTFTPTDLAKKIANGDEESLKAVKGIGVKTAQRIIVDLKKKVAKEMFEQLHADPQEALGEGIVADKELIEEATKAFVALGYPAAAARKVAVKIAKANPGVSINDMIRMGLRMF
ncbi:Holliday junction branch migration protein RuvA [Porphyromonas sp.]|uniref:Holliday junction branch migration protein RuvA n=1 Tax=Porphyromonas sp. TaxID=1924944 RepID=UPI0026DBE08A|nr:Holliday junction branch migration protein RuvA [Porphyromonas sp.]MDO4770898.1 Holliday junction branch migration protein RuvA [Porphyromonas sp.]